MRRLPRIAEVKCSRIQFAPGDRVLVRIFQSLDREQRKRLERSIQRWAGPDVEVLIYNATKMEVTIDTQQQRLAISPGLV